MNDGDRDMAVTSTQYLLQKVCQAGAVNHVSIMQDEVLGVGVACSKRLITIRNVKSASSRAAAAVACLPLWQIGNSLLESLKNARISISRKTRCDAGLIIAFTDQRQAYLVQGCVPSEGG